MGGDLSGEIAGAGATSQEAAQEAWIANFENENSGATISYDPVGSGGGREQFIAGGVAFAGSDAAISEEEGEAKAAIKRCSPGELIEVPAYVSPIAIIYNLPEVESLQLSAETLAKIFNQEITSGTTRRSPPTTPASICPTPASPRSTARTSPGRRRTSPNTCLRSSPSVWTHEVSGDWPVKGGEAASGTSGVVEAVGAGEGAIGYADASQAGELGIAKIEVGKAFVEPTPEAAAAILEESPEDKELSAGKYTFPFALDRKTEAEGTYPIVLVSYLLACTEYSSADEAAVVKGYLEYAISPEGQEAAAENAGSAPLSAALTTKITPAVEAIEAG